MMDPMDLLLVEDDVSLREVTRDFLEDHGFRVTVCGTGSDALRLIGENRYKLIILDVNLPDLIGFDICGIVRKTSKVPILFLSARITDLDKITGLEAGADDYISKPYSLNELLSRIKAHIRRKYDYDREAPPPGEVAESTLQRYGELAIDREARKVYVNGEERELPAKEFELLSYLVRHKNKTIPKETLYNAVWGMDSLGEINTLSVHIRRLREKIEKDPSSPQLIKTVWSVGFRFEG